MEIGRRCFIAPYWQWDIVSVGLSSPAPTGGNSFFLQVNLLGILSYFGSKSSSKMLTEWLLKNTVR